MTNENLEATVKSKLSEVCENATLCPYDPGSTNNTFILQKWSSQWNAFIDFSLDDDVENGDKLKVSEYKTLEVSALFYQGYYYYCFFLN